MKLGSVLIAEHLSKSFLKWIKRKWKYESYFLTENIHQNFEKGKKKLKFVKIKLKPARKLALLGPFRPYIQK